MAKMGIDALLKELNKQLSVVASEPGRWAEFLKSSAWNYKYNFQNQLLIYSQRSDATACADFDVWNTRLHRYVVKGAKGIAVLNDIGDRVGYVFDVSDTRSPDNDVLKLWKLADENYVGVLSEINLVHEFNCESVEDALVRQVDYFVENAGALYLPEGDVRENSEFIAAFNECVKYSSLVVALWRCGFEEAANTYANAYLQNVGKVFDSNEKVIALGTAVSSISELVLREVEHDVKLVNKRNLNISKENVDVEVIDNGNDIQTGRGISDSGDFARDERTSDGENREDGIVEAEVSSIQQTDALYDASDARRVGEAFDGNRGDGEPAEGAVDSEPSGRESGTVEEGEPDGVDATYEFDSVDGGRGSEEGTDIPLDDVLFPTVEEQLEIIEEVTDNSQGFELSQQDIDDVLVHGSNIVDGKFRIYDFFNEKHSVGEKVEFLKDEYGLGGATVFFADGMRGYVGYEGSGIKISKYQSVSEPDIVLNWNKVQKRIGELIKEGRYLNDKEVADYPEYKVKLEHRFARAEVANKFVSLVHDYNDFLRANNRFDDLLNQYVLVDCGSCFTDGRLKTGTLSMDGDYILPLMTDALNTIIHVGGEFQKRCEEIFDSFSGVSLKALGYDADDGVEVENKLVSVPVYKVGDVVYNGATKYSIVEIGESSVYLSDVEFELNSLDLTREDFEKIVLENPSNSHLVKMIPEEDYNELINHAVALVDEVQHSVLPDEETVEIVNVTRVGDFFEIRGEDVARVAELLELIPTSKVVDGERVPLVGFPVRYLDLYNEKLGGTNIVLVEAPSEELSEVSETNEVVEETEVVKRNSLVARNYDALNRLAPGVFNGDYTYLRFESSGFEPLSVEKVGSNLISVMHTFIQNGDVMRDPDIVLLVDNKNKTVTTASYEMSAVSLYEEYIDFDSLEVINEQGQKDANSFFRDWMKNVAQQGYSLVRGVTRDGDEVFFDAGGNEISEEAFEGLKEKYQVRLHRQHDNPNVVKAYASSVNAPLEPGHIIDDSREVFESREAAENAVENFNTVFGFDEEFRMEQLGRVPEPVLHRYYSTQRPVGPGTYPKHPDWPVVNIVNFDERTFVEDIDRGAWGYVEFARALPLKQAEDYELIKAPVVVTELPYAGGEDNVRDANEFDINKNLPAAEPWHSEALLPRLKGLNDSDNVASDRQVRGNGEFTGYTVPRSDVELNEGDVVEYTYRSDVSDNSLHKGVIRWNDSWGDYFIEFDDLAARQLSTSSHDITKLGSIYNEPELLGKASNPLGFDEFAVRLRLNDEFVGGIEVYVEKADVPCPETDIQISTHTDENYQGRFRSHIENMIEDNQDYRDKQYSALLEKKAQLLEKEVALLKPVVYCEWSEHGELEDEKEYSFVEFNSLMKKFDKEVFDLKQEYRARDEYYPYFKTKFAVKFPDGFEYGGRQDIGDGDGSLLDHIRRTGEHTLGKLKENGYDGYYKGEELNEAIKYFENLLNVYVPMLEKEVQEVERSYDKELYQIGYGSLGNGTTVWNSADVDKEVDDYRTIAHISDDGTVKFYVNDLPDGVKNEIKDRALGFTREYLRGVLAMSQDEFRSWYLKEMVAVHPQYIPGKDFKIGDYVHCYNALHEEGFVRDVELPLISQLEQLAGKDFSEAAVETRNDIAQKIRDGEITSDDLSRALSKVDGSQMQSVNDVYDVLAKEYVDEQPVARQKVGNFRITDVNLGVGGPKEKYRNNVAAIRLLKQLEDEGRLATADEQVVLSKYVGWGGLDAAFDGNNGSWVNEYRELQELLTTDEYRSAKASTLSSFYTQPVVIDAIYDGLRNLGFKRGNVLEPSCGVGNFFGLLPEEFSNSSLYGVELDSVSGRIAKQLYPEAKIAVKGYEETNFKDGFFDVAIGNVPFGQFKVNDKEYNKLNFMIHDYFFAKTLDKVRPGGIVAFITSKGTLDKQNPEVRKYIAQRAELLGAIRLPNNAFLANAGTKATSDIIFLQKRENALEVEPDWVHLGVTEDGIPINSYFVEHPEMVLGHMEMDRMQYGREDSTCVPIEGAVLSEQLAEVIGNIQGKISSKSIDFDEALDNDKVVADDFVISVQADPDVRNFSYTLVDDEIYYRLDNEMIKQEFNPTREKRVRGLIEIRESLRHLIDLQRYNHSDYEIEAEQSKLNKLYDAYTEKYGLINSRGNSLAFQDDNSYYLLCSLENVDEKGELISKADMFTKKTIKQHIPVVSVGTASEALSVSISEKARVDLDYMSGLADMPKEKLVSELQGVIYQVPGEYDENGNDFFVTSDEYLSGDVREKLRIAQAYAEEDSRFKINVAALEQVIPKDLEPHEISLRLGSIWIPDDVVNEFMWNLLETPEYYRDGTNAKKAFYNEINGSWSLSNKDAWDNSVLVNSTYGTDRINAYNIIYNTLNLKTVEIYDNVETSDGKKTRVRNVDETIVAQQKQEAIKNKFLEWIWTDPERRQRLVRIYNDKFNSIRPREYSGEHLVFEGINPEITLMEHQKNAVAHAIYGGNTLLAHEVGAGKTFEMIAIAMESKRLGLCSKSMMVVPNHLIGQWASDFYQLYPSANLLVATKKDFEPANRKKFCSRIATGDYDAVIIGHSQFEKIPLSLDTQERFIQEELDEVEQGIRELKWANGDNVSVKSLEKTRKNLEIKLEKMQDIEQDDVITFEELGVDRIFVDEAHYFKNLFLYTKMRNIAGVSQTEAKKSSDLFMKTRYLDETTDSRGVVFATGTPISNSMTEAYTMQRYLQYNVLKDNGFSHFDAWASTFGEVVTAVELSPEGTGYRAKERFAKFHNIPEFMSYFKMMADIKTGDELNLPKPDVEFHVVQAQPTELQEQIVQSLGERASKVRGGGVDSKEDNMLKITNDGRLLGLDQRCYNEELPDNENSKVNLAIENIFNIWEAHKDEKLAQLVFCDLSTPNNGKFSVYEDVKQKLIDKGVPEDEIAFIHDANTDTRKENLFSDVRSGNVRILMGSTQKMGAGTNVQNKLIALHDLDCPWRPSDLEQRLGRILRQGNEQDKVQVYRYVTQGTFDAYLWQLVENKQKFISQIMTSKSPVRVAEDIDDTALSYAEIKSLCIKDPRIQEKMELDIDVAKLKVVKGNFMSQKYRLEDNIAVNYPKRINNLEQSIKGYNEDIKTVQEQSLDSGFTPMIIRGIAYSDPKEAGKALYEACKGVGVDKTPVGSYKGLNMFVYYEPFNAQKRLVLKGALSHEFALTKVASRNMELIDDEISRFNKNLEGCLASLEETKKNLETAKIEVKKEFPQEEELKSKLARLEELNVLLNNDNEEKDNHLDFKVENEYLTKYRGMGGDVVIPDNVVGISGYVFQDNHLIESVVIPDSVTAINYGAFSNCRSLTRVVIPDKLLMDSGDDFISTRFKGCPVAEELEARKIELNSKRPPFQIEDGVLVKYWGNDTDIVVPDGVKEIGNSVFMGRKDITSVVIPDGVVKIGCFAFDDCFKLASIQIPDSVKEIGYYAFQKCKSLTDVQLPNSLSSIESHLFWGCESLESVVIPDGVTEIESGAFSFCKNLLNVDMSDDLLKAIGSEGKGDRVFYESPCLTTLKDEYEDLMRNRSLNDVLANAKERSEELNGNAESKGFEFEKQ